MTIQLFKLRTKLPAFKVADAMRQTAFALTVLLMSVIGRASTEVPQAHTRAETQSSLIAQLRSLYPNTQFESVQATVVPDLYEVHMQNNVAYVHAQHLRYFLFGRLIDTQTLQEPHPQPRELAQNSVNDQTILPAGNASQPPATRPLRPTIHQLPTQDAIRIVQGNGKRWLAVFSDPACPYCQQLDRVLQNVRDLTIDVYMVPLLGLSLPRAIWCAPNRQVAWQRVMHDPQAQLSSAECKHPLERNRQLASQWGVRGTPTLVFADGFVHEGYVDQASLELLLTQHPLANSADQPRAGGSHE